MCEFTHVCKFLVSNVFMFFSSFNGKRRKHNIISTSSTACMLISNPQPVALWRCPPHVYAGCAASATVLLAVHAVGQQSPIFSVSPSKAEVLVCDGWEGANFFVDVTVNGSSNGGISTNLGFNTSSDGSNTSYGFDNTTGFNGSEVAGFNASLEGRPISALDVVAWYINGSWILTCQPYTYSQDAQTVTWRCSASSYPTWGPMDGNSNSIFVAFTVTQNGKL